MVPSGVVRRLRRPSRMDAVNCVVPQRAASDRCAAGRPRCGLRADARRVSRTHPATWARGAPPGQAPERWRCGDGSGHGAAPPAPSVPVGAIRGPQRLPAACRRTKLAERKDGASASRKVAGAAGEVMHGTAVQGRFPRRVRHLARSPTFPMAGRISARSRRLRAPSATATIRPSMKHGWQPATDLRPRPPRLWPLAGRSARASCS